MKDYSPAHNFHGLLRFGHKSGVRGTPWVWLILAVIMLPLLLTSTALAQEPTPSDDEVNAIAKELYCPVCENVPLDVCPTQACKQWRDVIRDKLGEGWNEGQIKDYFALQYGDRVLAEPPRRGLNWLVYVLPPAAVLVGVFVLYRAFSAWRVPASDSITDPATPVEDDEYIQRLEEELKRR